MEVDVSGAASAVSSRALAFAALYRVLAVGFSEPDGELVEALRRGDVGAEVADCLAELHLDDTSCAASISEFEKAAEVAGSSSSESALRNLRVEYARLFSGPGLTAVSGYESQYVDAPKPGERGPLFGETAEAVAAAYAGEGVATSAGNREPPDFVAIELEFLYHLALREEEALRRSDHGGAERLNAAAQQFLDKHAAVWMPRLAAEVEQATESEFYRALATLLAGFIGLRASVASEVSEARSVHGAGDVT